MRVERHYDDEALISLAESNRDASDSHLPTCTMCSEKLQSVRAIARSLKDATVWDKRELSEDPVPSTIATLRAFADRMSDEDARAEGYVRELLEGPRESWRMKLDLHPQYRTAGVVRKLIATSDHAINTMPVDAVVITGLATEIADHLPAALSTHALSSLRGAAWRQKAYALLYTGQYPEALAATERADAEFARCPVSDYDRARTGIVKSLILRAFDRLHEAEVMTRENAATFLEYEDLDRLASARIVEAYLLVSRGDVAAANAILESLEVRLRDSDLVETHARVLANLGNCARRLGQWDRSIQLYDLSTGLFEALEIPSETTRNRWNGAKVAMEAGRLSDAHRRLDSVIREMDTCGMAGSAAMARLDLAELLLTEERFDEVDAVCRAAMQSFERSGLAYSERALVALAFIREAAKKRTASPELVRNVREYLNRLPSEPRLMFAYPPQ